jgi:hypothetical protein
MPATLLHITAQDRAPCSGPTERHALPAASCQGRAKLKAGKSMPPSQATACRPRQQCSIPVALGRQAGKAAACSTDLRLATSVPAWLHWERQSCAWRSAPNHAGAGACCLGVWRAPACCCCLWRLSTGPPCCSSDHTRSLLQSGRAACLLTCLRTRASAACSLRPRAQRADPHALAGTSRMRTEHAAEIWPAAGQTRHRGFHFDE